MSAAFALGQRIYSRNGNAAQFLMYLNRDHSTDRFVVEPFYSLGEDGGEYLAGIETWHEAFAEPPRKVVDGEVAALHAKSQALREEIEALEKHKRAIEQRRVDTAATVLGEAKLVHAALAGVVAALAAIADQPPAKGAP